MILFHDVLVWFDCVGGVLLHHDEVPFLEVEGIAVVTRQSSFGLLNHVLSLRVVS